MHFITGTSKDAVTTGLIGGRVGNKGGVGVSINLDGITLLFVNAHLAGKPHYILSSSSIGFMDFRLQRMKTASRTAARIWRRSR